MRFEIKAYRPAEGVVSLWAEAPNAEEAGNLIFRQGFEVIAIRTAERWNPLQRQEAPLNLLNFTQELRSLLDAGLSLIESLSALARKEGGSSKRHLIEGLIRQLREGKAFSTALRESPDNFPPLYLALTAASEQTGDLSGALGRFIDYRQQMDALRKQAISAAIYPALLLAVGGLVIAFLMGYVVPRFSLVYEDFGGNLPFLSRLLLQWGRLIDAHAGAILLVLAGTIGMGIVFLRRRRLTWLDLLHRMLAWKAMAPLRERIRIYALARFYRTTGLLLLGGISLVAALDMAGELLDQQMRDALKDALQQIRGGMPLSDTLQQKGLAPPVASDLLRIGEKAGDMGEKMIRIADFYDGETRRWADWFTRLFEPMLMLVIGLFIAFIIVLLYLPIFELTGSLQ